MSDQIEITGLRLLGVHGALPSEQHQPQPFRVDLVLETDFVVPAVSDELTDAIDYGVVVDQVRSVVEDGHFQLLEALAEAIAVIVLGDDRVRTVIVRLTKLRPPVPCDLASAGVRITRHQLARA